MEIEKYGIPRNIQYPLNTIENERFFSVMVFRPTHGHKHGKTAH